MATRPELLALGIAAFAGGCVEEPPLDTQIQDIAYETLRGACVARGYGFPAPKSDVLEKNRQGHAGDLPLFRALMERTLPGCAELSPFFAEPNNYTILMRSLIAGHIYLETCGSRSNIVIAVYDPFKGGESLARYTIRLDSSVTAEQVGEAIDDLIRKRMQLEIDMAKKPHKLAAPKTPERSVEDPL